MTNRVKLALGLAVGFGALAPVAFADEANGITGMEACAEALMASISDDSDATEYVVRPQGRDMEHSLRRTQVIYLDAQLGDDNIAKANCRVNADAEVTELELLPQDAPEARRRAL